MDTCMDVSVGGWWLDGYMNGYVGRSVVVGLNHGWIVRFVVGGWLDTWIDVPVSVWWFWVDT